MATVTRTKPWRQYGGAQASDIQPLLGAFTSKHPDMTTDAIERAYTLAAFAHEGQNRKSGEPYIRHPVAVASLVAGLGLDDVSVAAALLHDTVEDTPLTIEEIDDELGDEVAMLVDGLTKIDRLKFDSKE